MITAVTDATKLALFDALVAKTRSRALVWKDDATQPNRYVVTAGNFTFTADDFGLIKIDNFGDDLPALELHVQTAERGLLAAAIREYRRNAEELTQQAVAVIQALEAPR